MDAECSQVKVCNNELEGPSTSSDPLARLGMCEVCGGSFAKYTCPRCEVKTCCLKCTKIHKKELECDGTRNKTKFVPINRFNNLELSSDYRLLEEITRNVDYFKKNKVTRYTRQKGNLPYHLHMLRLAANERKTILKFLPRNFKRHKENTTYLKFNSNIIYWHIDWTFFNADNITLSDSNLPETTNIINLLHKYLIKQEDTALQEKLQYYQAASLPGIKIFLKAEEKPGCKFYELDPLVSLKENLKNKIIIEYPIIHLVLKEHASLYNILDSDDDDEELNIDIKQEDGHLLVNRIIKNSERDDSIDNSLKNLLFVNDQSDGDMSD